MVHIREMSPKEPVFKEVVVESCNRPMTAPTFRTVRELKREQTKRPPSIRYVEHVSDAFTYVTRHVDPVMSRVVSELLVHKPQNVALAMLEYFRWRASGSPALDDPSVMFRLKQGAEKTDRLYAVRHVTPLLSELMRELAVEQPKDLNGYVIDALTQKLKASGEAVPPLPSAAPPSTTEAPTKSQAKADGDTARPPTGAGDTLPSEDTSPPPGPPPAPFVKAFNVLLLGMDGAGKSSLLATLKGDLNPCPQPTIGFRFAKMMTDGGTRVTFYDLGGGMDPRRLWVNYYHDVHGVIFVLDGAEAGRWQESVDLLGATLAHKYLANKPLLLLLSKQDQPGARTPEALQHEPQLGVVSSEARREDVRVSGAVLNASKNSDVIDPRLEQSLQWLFERVKQGFASIDARVQRDTAEAKEEFAREEALKDRERLKNFIHKACLEAEAGGSDCFTPQEGLTFLCEEIGVDAKDLPQVAKDVASGVGYQKHALQMVGNMKNPIAQGKKVLEWDEIWQRVASLRVELGLPEKAPARE